MGIFEDAIQNKEYGKRKTENSHIDIGGRSRYGYFYDP